MSGVADKALRLTAQYTTERKQFDRAIGTFQAVGQRMADCFIDNQAIELTMLQAATHLDEGRDDPLEVATAKFWAAEGGNHIAHAALHIHGGVSIDVDFPIHRYFLWLKQLRVHARLGHAGAAPDRQGARRHPRLTASNRRELRHYVPARSRRFASGAAAISSRRRTGARSNGGPVITMRCSAPASR